MASRYGHCLGELLYRWKARELKMDVVAIVSNYSKDAYDDPPGLHDVPHCHFQITAETKAKAYRRDRALRHR